MGAQRGEGVRLQLWVPPGPAPHLRCVMGPSSALRRAAPPRPKCAARDRAQPGVGLRSRRVRRALDALSMRLHSSGKSNRGDLRLFFSGFFDAAGMGTKLEAASYRNIAQTCATTATCFRWVLYPSLRDEALTDLYSGRARLPAASGSTAQRTSCSTQTSRARRLRPCPPV